uniref:Uncharacterized protein n=1 Tax=Ignisphaera aggregans TaxID=334771 RepID=A0A7C5UWC5_9CREN
MRLQASVSIAFKNTYEFTKVLKRLIQCGIKNIKADSINNYIHFELENINIKNINIIFECLNEFKEIFLIADLKAYMNIPNSKLDDMIKTLNIRKMPLLYPYRIIAVINYNNYLLAIQKTSNRNVYLIRCIGGKNVDVVLPPSSLLFIGPIDTVRNEISRCTDILNSILNNIGKNP